MPFSFYPQKKHFQGVLLLFGRFVKKRSQEIKIFRPESQEKGEKDPN